MCTATPLPYGMQEHSGLGYKVVPRAVPVDLSDFLKGEFLNSKKKQLTND